VSSIGGLASSQIPKSALSFCTVSSSPHHQSATSGKKLLLLAVS
jgi:hypothetical protein